MPSYHPENAALSAPTVAPLAPQPRQRIFVFGSNLSGQHGKGAALVAAQQYGAARGVGAGRTGNAYALPTKGARVYPRGGRSYLPVLPLDQVAVHAALFCLYARQNQHLEFQLTAVGCGLAGYTPEQVAPMFAECGANVLFPPEWRGVAGARNPEWFWAY